MAPTFQPGDRVEICSQEDGFQGSYLAATVISRKPNGSYLVQYSKLVDEYDERIPLREVVRSDEVRPISPRSLPLSASEHLTKVDAYDKDAWWVGEITGKKGSMFIVYFDLYNCEIAYPITHLKPHKEFVNGKWIYSPS
ncbi:protein AGENET DOMAIN (AGD)-CONTAINING P1 [Rutidosis leptorrhynchoides]|uniref:protein AGENET DOMAIN (AGD)-CONTAINING P1 n=1 Tax=Rutidosis leptorrhynchoides TaxID=125765 RepID=UPI003A99C519